MGATADRWDAAIEREQRLGPNAPEQPATCWRDTPIGYTRRWLVREGEDVFGRALGRILRRERAGRTFYEVWGLDGGNPTPRLDCYTRLDDAPDLGAAMILILDYHKEDE
jgi:hypothetical protein